MRELTFKQERFCNAFVSNGGIVREAYIQAYGKGNATDKTIMEQASRLRNNHRIIARIKELIGDKTSNDICNGNVSRQQLITKLWQQCNFQIYRLFKETEDGRLVPKDILELTEDEQSMIQGWDDNGYPIIINKAEIMKLLMNIQGFNTDESHFNEPSSPELYTAKDVCQILQVTRQTLYKWEEKGKLKPIRINKTIRYSKAEIDNLTKK